MEAAALKQQILDAGRVVVGSQTLGPANENFHRARYNLYSLAAAKIDPDLARRLSRDPEIRAMADAVFPLSCEAGVYEECDIARHLLSQPDLDFETVYQGYYGHIYEILMKDELDWFRTNGINLENARIAYIGGGAMPVPAFLMARNLGARVTIFDPDEESCALAMALADRIGLKAQISVKTIAGEDALYERFDIAWIANWITDKMPIFRRIHEFSNVRHVVARSAAAETLSFIINDELDCDRCGQDFELLHTTPKHDDMSLVSVIFKNPPCVPEVDETMARPVVDSMSELIGNTPMLRMDPAKTGLKNIQLYAKLEHLNPFGSVKDRTAFGMIGGHIKRIAAEGREVLEMSSGNAARALQAIASMHGSRLETVSGRIRVEEMRKVLKLQGAKVTPMDANIDPTDAYAALHAIDSKADAEADHYFYTDQYRNPANDGSHYMATGREIIRDLGPVDYLIGAVGTAGSTVGISRSLREANPDLKIIGVVSEESDFVPGIRHKGEIFNVGAFREDYYESIVGIHAMDAIKGVVYLMRDFGVMAGPSSGAAYIAALRHLKALDDQLTSPRKAVFIVCDRVELYLSYIEARRPDLFI
jgi:cysteine synthase